MPSPSPSLRRWQRASGLAVGLMAVLALTVPYWSWKAPVFASRTLIAVLDPVCGNGVKEAGEECDDGNGSNTDTCTNICMKPKCGDGYVQPRSGEDCDPPGPENCSAFCIDPNVDHTSSASSASSGPKPHCGNGALEKSLGEECDLGARNGISPYCTRMCTVSYCGDGHVAESEECEPPRTASGALIEVSCGKACQVPDCSGEECVGGCRWEFFPACPVAAPGSSASSAANIVSSSVASAFGPPSPFSSLSSASAAFVSTSRSSAVASAVVSRVSSASSASAVLTTSASSQISATLSSVASQSSSFAVSSSAALCGNGLLDFGEACDDGVNNSDSLPNRCSSLCQLPACGNGLVDTALGEECDSGALNTDTLPDACRLNCRQAYCGDGVVDTGEECDDANAVATDACDACSIGRCPDGSAFVPGQQCAAAAVDCTGPKCDASLLDDQASFSSWWSVALQGVLFAGGAVVAWIALRRKPV